MTVEFQVQRHNLPECRLVEREDAPLLDGQVRLKVEQFSFTANNMTYGVAGDILGYWQFFPAADNDGDKWGLIPVWAFAEVVESKCEQIPVGDRWYGYFPPAGSVVMEPTHVSKTTLTDGVAHRQKLPPLYNRYRRVAAEPGYDKSFDVARSLLAPLHITSFCLFDYLQQKNAFGAEQILIISASSKTSLGLAYGLNGDDAAPHVIGLTSNRNVEFVENTKLYDEVVAYDDVAAKIANKPTTIVDMGGIEALRNQLYDMLGDNLVYYIGVGMTHYEERGAKGLGGAIPGKKENFFAPSYVLERMKELEPGEFDKRSQSFVQQTAKATFGWMSVETHAGLEGLKALYPSFCDGSVDPAAGHMITMAG